MAGSRNTRANCVGRFLERPLGSASVASYTARVLRPNDPLLPSEPSAIDEDALRRAADSAIALLEQIQEKRALLAALSEEQRARLLQAAGHVARPDPWAKRELVREAKRRRREAQRAADEAQLSQTGIRQKRREQVFQTPRSLPAPLAAGVNIDEVLAAPEAPALAASA